MGLPLTGHQVSEIKSLHEKIVNDAKSALEKAIQIGKLLSEAKRSIKDGDWRDWVEATLPFTKRTADNYLRLFNQKDELTGHENISEALLMLRHCKSTHEVETGSHASVDNQRFKQNGPVSHKPLQINKTSSNKGGEKLKLLDEKGYPIPAEIAPLWERRNELQELMTKISEVKCHIERSLSEKDILYRGIGNHILMELKSIHYQISNVRAYAVCTDCQGYPNLNPTPCQLCYGTGFIGKHSYDTVTAVEKREMRELKIKRGRA